MAIDSKDARSPAPGSLSRAAVVEGVAWSVFATLIWGGWMVITGFGVQTGLDGHDIAAIRLGMAGLLMLPVVARMGFGMDRLGLAGLAALVTGAGAPFVFVMVTGIQFAPAAHASALINGLIPLFVALFSFFLFKERVSGLRLAGLGLVVAGAAGFWTEGLSHPHLVVGHALFLLAAVLWSCFTVTARYAALTPLHATAIVSVCSLVLYVPVYFVWFGPKMFAAPLWVLAVQTVYQGVLAGVVAVFAFVRAINLLGASRAAAFMPLAPALAMLMAVPALGQWPNRTDVLSIALVGLGVFLATGIVGRRAK